MTNPVTVDMKDILVAFGYGTFGDTIHIGKEPDKPANCITLYDMGGLEQNAKISLDNIRFQVRVRNKSYINGYNILDRIKRELDGRPPGTINGSRYVGYWATSYIIFLERDESDRAIFVCNFRVIREPANIGSWKLAI